MEHIAYVSQDNYLFHLSIRENIRIGKPNATNSEIENTAKKAACHDFIASLWLPIRLYAMNLQTKRLVKTAVNWVKLWLID